MWFDGQAKEFEDSAGLEPGVGRRVAEAIVELSGATGDDLILDIGAGTGTIGRHFATLPHRYLGLELSGRMLAVFQQKLDPMPPNISLAEADCDRRWPADDRTVTAVFASRVVHHLKPRHFVEETQRVCRPGGCLLFGRVTRDPESLPGRLQRYKRTLLTEYGFSKAGGEQAVRHVLDDCRAMGATPLPPTTVASWTRSVTPRQLLDAWERKPALTSGGMTTGMSAEQRAAAVKALTSWTRAEFGDLDRTHEVAEDYRLQGVTWNQIS
ncbi:MAG TPA: methyltransferase domain-containing protein [Vicinamibacterales bacterium]